MTHGQSEQPPRQVESVTTWIQPGERVYAADGHDENAGKPGVVVEVLAGGRLVAVDFGDGPVDYAGRLVRKW